MEITYNKKLEQKEFFSLLFITVLPLLIQAFFMQSITFIDQIMIGSIGTDAIAAIGASNKVIHIYNAFLYGSCSASAMFLAQYWGKKDIKSFQKILGITLTSTVTVGIIFSVIIFTIPHQILSLFNADASVSAYGVEYLQVLIPMFIIMGIVFPLNFALRSMNKVKVTMTSTIISVLLNVTANYILIFGKFGFPEMGVQGAAIATLLTRVVELVILTCYFKFSNNVVLKSIKNLFTFSVSHIVEYYKRAITLIANEMMWSVGTTIYLIIYSQTGTDALAAMSIMQTMQMLSKILVGSFCGSSSIIIGNEIGKGDLDKVNRYCKRFHKVALVVGLISSGVVLLLINPIQIIYNIQGTAVGDNVVKCMYVLSIFIILNSCNSINVEGIFRSGGDVKFISLMDMGSIWLVGMPVTFIAGVVLKLDVVYIYCAYIVLELYKLPLGYFRFKSGKWLNKLHETTTRKVSKQEEYVA